jgi:predicted N-formylglutamate amidohydrolase
MPKSTDAALLEPDEPPAVFEEGLERRGDFLVAVDHASARIPRRLGDLGLPATELQRHIAWDIGALGVARRLAAALDSPVVAQNYSRLVIDCNRHPDVPTSIPTTGELIPIPGNIGLDPADMEARRREVFWPYQNRLQQILDARRAAGQRTILVAQHSMTNVFKGVARPMHAAILYNRDRRFAGLVLDALRREPGLIVADNEPYFVSDATDYTVPVHGEARRLAHVEIEVRQDLVTSEEGQAEWATRIATAIRTAAAQFTGESI